MPIQITCTCGKQLRVPEAHAGRRVQCPGCGAAHEVSQEAVTTVPVVHATPRIDPTLPEPSALVRFPCATCGHLIQARQEHAGRTARCPKCQQATTIPAPGQTRPHTAGKRGMVVLLFVLLLVPAVLGGAGAAWWLWLRQPAEVVAEGDDLALIPSTAQGFSTFRLADLWQLPAMQEAIRDARRRDPSLPDPTMEMDRLTGLVPTEVERLSTVGLDAEGRLVWAVLRTVQPYDRRKVLARLRDGQERGSGAQTYYAGTTHDGRTLAVHFAGSRVLVFGPEEGVRRCLVLSREAPNDGPLRPLIAQARESHAVVAGLAGQPGLAEALRRNPQTAALAEVRLASVVVDVADQAATLNLRVHMKDEAAARELKKAIDAQLLWVRGAALLGGLAGGDVAKLAARANRALGGLKMEVQGDELTAGAKGDPADAAAAAVLLLPRLLRR